MRELLASGAIHREAAGDPWADRRSRVHFQEVGRASRLAAPNWLLKFHQTVRDASDAAGLILPGADGAERWTFRDPAEDLRMCLHHPCVLLLAAFVTGLLRWQH